MFSGILHICIFKIFFCNCEISKFTICFGCHNLCYIIISSIFAFGLLRAFSSFFIKLNRLFKLFKRLMYSSQIHLYTDSFSMNFSVHFSICLSNFFIQEFCIIELSHIFIKYSLVLNHRAMNWMLRRKIFLKIRLMPMNESLSFNRKSSLYS